MRLHTALGYTEVWGALQDVKRAGKATKDVTFEVITVHKSPTHPHAYEVQLGTCDKTSLPPGTVDQYGKKMRTRRYKNTGNRGASSGDYGSCGAVWAATWHEWGWLIQRVFELDPTARWGSLKYPSYASPADFAAKTRGVFEKQGGQRRMSDDDGIVTVTGRERIENIRLITLRGALKLEITTGMLRSSRGRSTLALVNEAMGTGYRRKREAYEAFNLYLTGRGLKSRPLPEEK